MSAKTSDGGVATTEIFVSPPDTSDVRTGTTWYIESTGKVCLVMSPITDDVFNIAFWDENGEFGDKSTQVSMMGDDVLASCADLIAEPLPALVAMIESVEYEAMERSGGLESN